MKFVAYYRVSTARQGQSGLGLEAQEEAVRRLIDFRGGEIIASFKEVESGAKNDRTQLTTALTHAKSQNATLVVAKLDRLSRDAKFLLTLADSSTPILFGDFPDLDATTPVGRMVLTQMAAVAEFERRRISERVTAALQAAKARGVKLGGAKENGGFTKEINEMGRLAKIEKADKIAMEAFSLIQQIDPESKMSRLAIARILNERNIPTPRGEGNWGSTQITRVLKRVEAIHERKRAIAAKSVRSVSNRLQGKSRTVCKGGIGRSARPVARGSTECRS